MWPSLRIVSEGYLQIFSFLVKDLQNEKMLYLKCNTVQ